MPLLRKTVTALFCDLAGSTALAETLADPEAIHEVLTRYLRAMTSVIQRHGGTVEKFAGDAILGAFGVPVSHEDDAVRAVRAALEMRAAMSTLNVELRERWGISLEIKIGINTGEFLTGDSIEGQTMTLGDPMNVAARLEQTAGPGDIMLGEVTVRLLRDAVRVDEPRALALKGKADVVPAYRLVALQQEPVSARRFARPMVGRVEEARALREAFRRVAQSGSADTIVVTGAPGVGKSRLVAAAASAFEVEATTYWASCPSYGERGTFWPLAQIVRAHTCVVDADDGAAARTKLSRAVASLVDDQGERLWLFAGLASLLGFPPTDQSMDVLPDTLSACRRFLERVASRRPVVLVFEDLHWADDAFVDFLGSVARIRAPILILGTARTEIDGRLPGDPSATVLRLQPLGSDEIGVLVDQLAGETLPREMRSKVVERAGGNPLYAEALAALIAERGAEAIDEVPGTVEAIVGARLDSLPTTLHALTLDAAVAGTSLRATALASMSGLDVARVEDAMRDLAERDVLRPGGSPDEYEFRHELAREVAYKRIPRAARSAKHRAFASWLESLGGEAPADLLAHHSERAFTIAVEAREALNVRGPLAELSFRHQVAAAGHALRASDPQSATRLLALAAMALGDITDPDLEIVARAGRQLVTLGRWNETVDLLAPFAGPDHLPILRELGVAMCKLHSDDPGGDEYRQGQIFLERAASSDDVDAISSLAGTWKGIDEKKVRDLYRRASEVDPADPYALGNLLECEIQAARDISPVGELADRIAAAIERCRQQVAEARNLPWAYYDLGKFQVLLGRPSESLAAYAKALDLSPAAYMVETSLASLTRLSAASDVPGLAWARDLLDLALRAKFRDAAASDGSIAPPVVVLAGGTSSEEESRSDAYRSTLLDAFSDFDGTVVSGGTAHGVSGLAGELAERYPKAVRAVGYVPAHAPVETDERYTELRRTEATSFSPLEPLTYWGDLLRAGIRPSMVKVIGIGGGPVAAAEYAISVALGAELGVVAGSGRAADEIIADAHWSSSKRLTILSLDPETIRSFLSI